MKKEQMKLLAWMFCCLTAVLGETDSNDLQFLIELQNGLENDELLEWPKLTNKSDACGPPSLNYIFCTGGRVSQIQLKNLGLKGTLPTNFSRLSKLTNVGIQHNNFTGALPIFKNLLDLQYLYLGYNEFNTIFSDGLSGLPSLLVLSLDSNPLNKTGWNMSDLVLDSPQLKNLTLMSCNLFGEIPASLGSLPSLAVLELSYNRLSGGIPSTLRGSAMQVLWLNNQEDENLTGSIDVVATMTSLEQLWLHGNSLSGKIPEAIGSCTSLTELLLNGNKLVGSIPLNLSDLPLKKLQLDNNLFTGSPPILSVNYTFSGNRLCQQTPGVPCATEVTALLEFLAGVNYPTNIVESWDGNDPCSNWLGIMCSVGGNVSAINLPNFNLNGILSPSLGKLESLQNLFLQGNRLNGTIPKSLTQLKSLKMLNLSNNDLSPPVPVFASSVTLLTNGNPKLSSSPPGSPPYPTPKSPLLPPSVSSSPPPIVHYPPFSKKGKKESNLGTIAIPVACVAGFALFLGLLVLFCWKRRRTFQDPSTVVVHPKDPSDPGDIIKIAAANSNDMSYFNMTASGSQSVYSNSNNEKHVVEEGNLVISVQVLREVTRNFALENELGRGGFGTVYKGDFEDGTAIAVKRMEVSAISNKALDEFQAEIAVLSKVRHRHLVTLLGYSVEGSERLLVYEYMPQGALSKHLFRWKTLKLDPLSWKKRLIIALDVARGMEYLHNLAHRSFIHRDLKSSNILLGDDFHAKVSDFGLVKLAPDGKQSVVTRLAGTFGYLAPEYAVTGKITTKADVFSYGVVLMEMVTGLTALDEERPEESRYLAEWFWHIKSSKEKLVAAIDPAIDLTEETLESIITIAELAGHCTLRDPSQRPDMGHAVNVLSQLAEKWSPASDEQEDYMGIDCSQPLHQMVKGWQAADGAGYSMTSLDDSKGSIPARPTGFAESFTSADGR